MNVLNIEVILNEHKSVSTNSIIPLVQYYLNRVEIRPSTVLKNFDKSVYPALDSDVQAIVIGDVPGFLSPINLACFEIEWHVYTLDQHGPMMQVEDDEDNNSVDFATHLILPSADLFNLWENLFYENNIKDNLLKYAQTMMEFSNKGIDMNVISCNRVILLHGPPGTGKTSLCKALAQKLSIRLQSSYECTVLVEINSHSLFSKWFSESGKLVTKMFAKIIEMVENPKFLVCVLIDEIESLAHARVQCVAGNEPSDAIRVVNAVLTQIDKIKRYPNVLIFTTSNITESIDLAFIDRADIKQYLGLPTSTAIYKVYHSCIAELIKAQLLAEVDQDFLQNSVPQVECPNLYVRRLMDISQCSLGLSGRSLRKIPFIAYSLYIFNSPAPLDQFLDAMAKAVDREKSERKHFANDIK